MIRCQLLLWALLLAAGVIGTIISAELTEDEKKQLFLKSRERMRTVASPTPEASASPHHKPKPAKKTCECNPALDPATEFLAAFIVDKEEINA